MCRVADQARGVYVFHVLRIKVGLRKMAVHVGQEFRCDQEGMAPIKSYVVYSQSSQWLAIGCVLVNEKQAAGRFGQMTA